MSVRRRVIWEVLDKECPELADIISAVGGGVAISKDGKTISAWLVTCSGKPVAVGSACLTRKEALAGLKRRIHDLAKAALSDEYVFAD